MAKRKSKALVIDTSIVCAVGREDATFPTSVRCRDFLVFVRDRGFCVAMSPDIVAEWNDHASRFSRKWLVQMRGRKRVCDVENAKNGTLRQRVLDTTKIKDVRDLMQKDFHLIEAALVTDKTVASLDEKVRNHFRSAAVDVDEIKTVVWVNPDREDEGVQAWLTAGAPADKERQLGCVKK